MAKYAIFAYFLEQTRSVNHVNRSDIQRKRPTCKWTVLPFWQHWTFLPPSSGRHGAPVYSRASDLPKISSLLGKVAPEDSPAIGGKEGHSKKEALLTASGLLKTSSSSGAAATSKVHLLLATAKDLRYWANATGFRLSPVVVERATSFAKVLTLEKIGNGKRFVHKIPSSASDVAQNKRQLDDGHTCAFWNSSRI